MTDAIVDIITDAVCVRVRGTGAVAHAERVILAHAVVHIVADAIGIGIRGTAATAHADGVELVAEAITVAGWNARTVAYTALIEGAYAGVDIVTDAVSVAVARAIAATYADGINDVAIAVAISGGDVRASTFVNRTWSIANATGVHGADAIVDIIADAIRIGIRRAIATAHAEGIGLVAIAVAIACRDVGTATFEDGTGSAADATCVERGARSVIDGGIGVEVAGRGVRTPRDVRRFDAEIGHVRTDEFTTGSHDVSVHCEVVAAVAVGTAHAVTIAVIDGQRVAAVAELLRDRVGRVVGIAASRHDGRTGGVRQGPRGFGAVLVRIERHDEGLRTTRHTAAIVEGGSRVVVACRSIGAAVATEVAAAIVVDRCRVEVACRIVRAATVDLAWRCTTVRGQQRLAESARLEQGEHAVRLALREEVHAGVVGVIHVVLDHVHGAAGDIADGAAIVRTIGVGCVVHEVGSAACAVAPYVAEVEPVAHFVGGRTAKIERCRSRSDVARVLVAAHHSVRGGTAAGELGISKDATTDVAHPEIEVFIPRPGVGSTLAGEFDRVVRAEAIHRGGHTEDAGGGIALRVETGETEFNLRVGGLGPSIVGVRVQSTEILIEDVQL